jgi:exodeoxyribonuclease V beta subunit
LSPPTASPIPAPSPSRWSFSAIVQHDAEAWEPGTDEWMIVPEETGKKPAAVSTVDFHHFPKGIQAGLCLHELLEMVDFSEPATWPGAVRSALTTFGWEPEQWESILLRMLEQVAELPIPVRGSPFRLANLESGQLFREVEFSLPVAFDAVQYETVRRSFAAWTATQPFGAATLPAVRMAERLVPGMMQGVIDLWFLWEDQVHLLDWKSNWLGEDREAYHPANLALSMQEHHYHLQYLLYLVALRRFLRRVRPGFDYQQQFGGVHYLFLRGLESGNPADSVFQACPPESLILELDQCFSS